MSLRTLLRIPARAAAKVAVPFLVPAASSSSLGEFGREFRRAQRRQAPPRQDAQRYPNGQPATHATDAVRVLRHVRRHAGELTRTLELLADEESRNLLRRVLIYRALGPDHVHLPSDEHDPATLHVRALDSLKDSALAEPFGTQLFRVGDVELEAWPVNITADFFERQYFFERDGARVQPEPGDVVIDAGGCFGDTALVFAQAVGPDGHVHLFEPLPRQRAVIERNLARNPALAARISVHPFGLGDDDGRQVRFTDGGAGAHIAADGEIAVTIRTLDRFTAEQGIAPTFIKMDIEGAEQPAIRGAADTIRRHRPKLAISAYHSLDDLFGLAPLIHSIEPAYRFHLGHHTNFAEETVLYALVP